MHPLSLSSSCFKKSDLKNIPLLILNRPPCPIVLVYSNFFITYFRTRNPNNTFFQILLPLLMMRIHIVYDYFQIRLYTSCTFNFKPSVGRNKMNKAGMHGRLQRGDTVKFFCRTAIKVKHSFLTTLAPSPERILVTLIYLNSTLLNKF